MEWTPKHQNSHTHFSLRTCMLHMLRALDPWQKKTTTTPYNPSSHQVMLRNSLWFHFKSHLMLLFTLVFPR
uniref:Uncharacterized protein n=1 Tax=Arundo donax TaxID=35708 RepID=A0A0A9D131_ARUDO